MLGREKVGYFLGLASFHIFRVGFASVFVLCNFSFFIWKMFYHIESWGITKELVFNAK